IDFKYHITWAQGARIFIRPFTNGSLTPGYGASGSPIYSGEGNASASFTINSGTNVRVDHFRVRAVNPDQNILLAEFFVPVNWYWSSVRVNNISISGPIYPANGEDLTVEFDYNTNESTGVRIFPRPVTNGNLTPNYGACGSPIFAGTGNDDCDFTISATNQRVDHIRFRAVSSDQSQTLLEFFFPVNRFFGNFPVTSLVTCPPAPARLSPGENVNIQFGFINGAGQQTRVFPRPFTEGNLSPNYAASGSPAFPAGLNSDMAFFTINQDDVEVDQIRFKVVNADQTIDIAEYFVDRKYVFGNAVSTSAHSPLAPERLTWSIGPNPVQEQSILRLQSQDRQTVNIQLIDAMGRQIKSWVATELLAGQQHELALNRTELGLNAGLYFLHVQGTDYQVTETLVVQ
ncbi:MAG: T9SS type A sorting domain-containing protein, partial [Bacteroidota bacterium]